MAFRTGVTGTIAMSGQLTGFVNLYNGSADPDPPATVDGKIQLDVAANCGGAGVTGRLEFFPDLNPEDGDTLTCVYTLTTTAGGAGGTVHVPNGFDLGSGSYSMSTPVEEWIEFYGPEDGAAPFFAAVPDAPYWTGCRLFRTIAEGTISASISFGGFSAGGSVAATPGSEVSEGFIASCQAEGWWLNLSLITGQTSGMEVSITVDNPTDLTSGSVSQSANSGTVDANAGGCAVSYPAFDRSSHTSTYLGAASLNAHRSKPVSIDWAIRAMEEGYPDSLAVLVTGVPGTTSVLGTDSGSATGSQETWSVSALAGGPEDAVSPNTATLDTRSPVSVRLLSTGTNSLEANGDDPRTTRLPIRGRAFPGLSIAVADYTLDNGGSATGWAASGGGTVTSSGGVVIGPDGEDLTRTFSPQVGAMAHRYLRAKVRIVDAASVPLTFGIGPVTSSDDYNTEFGGGSVERELPDDTTPSKSWTFTTGADGAWSEFDIDLCAPHSAGSLTDDWDTKWPFPYSMSDYSGVWRIQTLSITGVPAGAHLEVDSLTLVVLDPTSVRFDFLPTWYPQRGRMVDGAFEMSLDGEWPDSAIERPQETLDSGTTVDYYIRRFLLARVDGRQTMEESDLSYTHVITSGGIETWNFSIPSIAELAGKLNGSASTPEGSVLYYPGVTATINAPANDSSDNAEDGYYNRDLPAVFLCGGGAFWDGDSWVFGFDVAGGADAQPLYDEVTYYPGCNPFGHGSGVFHAANIVRAQAHGLVLSQATTHPPLSGKTVNASESTIRGTGSSSSNGHYQTESGAGLHAAVATRNATVQADSSSLLREFWVRKRGRATFVLPNGQLVAARPLAVDSPRQWLHVGDERKVKTFDLRTGLLRFQSSDYADVDLWVGLDYDPRTATLLMLANLTDGAGGGQRVYLSRNGGRNGTGVLTVSSADSGVNIIDSERNRLCYFWKDSGSNVVKRQVSFDGGATWSSAVNVVYSGGNLEADVLDGEQDARAAGLMLLSVKFTADDSTAVLASRDLGANWTLLIS